MNKYYEMFSLVFGFASIVVITFYFIFYPERCALENSTVIRVIEIILGLCVIPYYIIKLWKLEK